MEDNINGKRHKWKANSMKDNINEKWPQWNTTIPATQKSTEIVVN